MPYLTDKSPTSGPHPGFHFMEIAKPLWLAHATGTGRNSHEKSAIFSCSIDASGTRIATAGLDCTIRVWYIDALTHGEESSAPKLEAIMSRHTGAVLCARWSPPSISGHSYLASVSDDSIVLIWQLSHNKYGNAAFEAALAGGSHDSTQIPQESYSVLHRLIGHESDVNSVEWSPDGQFLASCGLDGTILIWDVSQGFQLFKRLTPEPKRPLKGLVWDPLGQFLACQSDDSTLSIWRCGDWKLDTTLSSPYAEPIESLTYFSRPSWSPDGLILCIPDAINETETVALLVEREKWAIENSLVGHASSIQVSKFSPLLYKSSKKKDAEPFLLIALGSQDGVVSLWSSVSANPLAVLTGIFEHAVMDLVWKHDGKVLYAVSYDGTFAQLNISADLVGGVPVSEEEQTALINKLEKRPASSLAFPTSVNQIKLRSDLQQLMENNSETLAELPSAVALNGKADEALAGMASANIFNEANIAAQVQVNRIQQEEKLKNGKRHIAPQLLQPASPSVDRSRNSQRSHDVTIVGRPSRKAWIKAIPFKTNYSMSLSPEVTVEILNSKDNSRSKVSALRDSQVIWEEKFEGLATCATVWSDYTIVGTSKHSLHIYSASGRLYLPPLVFSSSPCKLAVEGSKLVVIFENGVFYCWELPSFRNIFLDELTQSVVNAELSKISLLNRMDGDILVSFEFVGGRIMCYSSFSRAIFDAESIPSVQPFIGALQTSDTIDSEVIMKILNMDEREIRALTISHMEAQIAILKMMGNYAILSKWIFIYAQRLALDEDYCKASELYYEVYEDLDIESKRLFKSILSTSSSAMIRHLADHS